MHSSDCYLNSGRPLRGVVTPVRSDVNPTRGRAGATDETWLALPGLLARLALVGCDWGSPLSDGARPVNNDSDGVASFRTVITWDEEPISGEGWRRNGDG